MKASGCFILLVKGVSIFGMTKYAPAGEAPDLSPGQTCYVPAYSHIYGGNRELPILLTVTLSIRNTDAKNAVTLSAVGDYGTKGN